MSLTYDESTLQMLAEAILRLPDSVPDRILVGIDGCGGAGKSTLAKALAARLPDSQIIATDDFASWEQPVEWWPRMLEQVFGPLSRGDDARYQRYDWVARRLAEWIDVQGRILLIEGVSSTRREFRPYLAARIWVECPRELRLNRGLERDGQGALSDWENWMAAEDAYVARDRPHECADFIVRGG